MHFLVNKQLFYKVQTAFTSKSLGFFLLLHRRKVLLTSFLSLSLSVVRKDTFIFEQGETGAIPSAQQALKVSLRLV